MSGPQLDGLDEPTRRRLPNLIVAGMQKCGTTALHYYLRRHPSISMSRRKELDFFIEDRGWRRGPAWYARHFDGHAPVRGESSPNYTARLRFPGVPERMYAVVPGAKLIFLVRDPIDRLVAHWMHVFAHGRESRPFRQACFDSIYVERSLYAMQLQPYFDRYPRERILIVDMNDLRRRRRETLVEVFDFLGVESSFWSARFLLEPHRTARKRQKTPMGRRIASGPLGVWIDSLPEYARWAVQQLVYLPFSRRLEPPVVDTDTHTRLIDRLRSDAGRFRSMTGRAFEGWSV